MKMVLCTFQLFSIFFFSAILPQAPDTMWTKKIGGTGIDAGIEIIQTLDEGFVIAGLHIIIRRSTK
jgi:hypothetical protein